MEYKEEGLSTLISANLNKNHGRGGFIDQQSGYSPGTTPKEEGQYEGFLPTPYQWLSALFKYTGII